MMAFCNKEWILNNVKNNVDFQYSLCRLNSGPTGRMALGRRHGRQNRTLLSKYIHRHRHRQEH